MLSAIVELYPVQNKARSFIKYGGKFNHSDGRLVMVTAWDYKNKTNRAIAPQEVVDFTEDEGKIIWIQGRQLNEEGTKKRISIRIFNVMIIGK